MDVGNITIGAQIRHIRLRRGKTQQLIADMAGMSQSHLQRIETGESPIDRISHVLALAEALQVAPSDLMRLPMPPPANGHTDSTIEAIRRAIDSVEAGHPSGIILPYETLKQQIVALNLQIRSGQTKTAAAVLPDLIRNTHTSINAGHDVRSLIESAVYLHTHGTSRWLILALASTDLIHRVSALALRLAHDHSDSAVVAAAQYRLADAVLFGGALDLGTLMLNSIDLPGPTADTAGVSVATRISQAASALFAGKLDLIQPAMDEASSIARRYPGQTPDMLGYALTDLDVQVCRMWQHIELGDPETAVTIGQGLRPNEQRQVVSQMYYWIAYGRALAQLRGRAADAVIALRQAEALYPLKVLRDPIVHGVLADLVARAKRDAIGRELRAMAYRAGITI